MKDFDQYQRLVEEVSKMDSLANRLTEEQLKRHIVNPASDIKEDSSHSDTDIEFEDPMYCSYGL